LRIETAWVKPPMQVGGLDHLAVQAPCINIYGRLIPGITNVTDRARYYSFYPWLIWVFDQQGYTRYDDEFIERFRRADCLFSLVAERHAAISKDEYVDHAAAMVGSNTLSSVARELGDAGTVTLSDYSAREGAKSRYFKNKLGGLGQYYLGVLRELSILDGDASQGIRYTREIGQPIAQSLGAGFDGDLFLSAVEADSVSASQLDSLSALCPCQLSSNVQEQSILGELFFARGNFYDLEALPRRRSLQSILHLAKLLGDEGVDVSESIYRSCVYASSLPNGHEWPVPDSLEGNRQKWFVYARNELLSVAVQGLFFALLDAYEESALRLGDSTAVVNWFSSSQEALGALAAVGANRSFSDCVVSSGEWLPPLNEWMNPDHEVQLAEKVSRLSHTSKSPANRQNIVIASLRTLIALASRSAMTDDPYGELVFDERYFQYYPINLRAFEYHKAKTWASLQIPDLLRWALLNWGIEVHLRVGLRKLRGQSQSTFRIRPSDRGLEVIAIPPAVHTRPRFNQSLRVLKDIGALEKNSSGRWQPSGMGQAMLELGDAP
jgi:hypothetical protein